MKREIHNFKGVRRAPKILLIEPDFPLEIYQALLKKSRESFGPWPRYTKLQDGDIEKLLSKSAS